MRKKVLAIAAIAAMIIIMMPTMAFAETCSDDPCNHEAAIGNNHYSSLQNAIDDVEEGQTIILLKNVNVTTPAYGTNALNYAKAVSCTIDLNDKTLSADTGNSVFRFNISGSGATSDVTVTMKNGKVISGPDTWCALMASAPSADAKAVFNLEDLTVESSKAGDFSVKAWGNSIIKANNVTINPTNGSGGFYALGGEVILDDCTVNQKGLHTAPYLSMAFGVSDKGKMTINSGTYSATPTASSEGYNQGSSHGSWVGGIMSSGGTLIIKGGTFSNDNYGDNSLATAARSLLMVDAYGDIQIEGGEFNALESILFVINNTGDGEAANPKAQITGGIFNAGDPTNSGEFNLFSGYPTGLLTIKGGSFPADVSEFIASGYVQDPTTGKVGLEGSFDQNPDDDGDTTPDTTDKPEDVVDSGDNMNVAIPFTMAGLMLMSMAAVIFIRRKAN